MADTIPNIVIPKATVVDLYATAGPYHRREYRQSRAKASDYDLEVSDWIGLLFDEPCTIKGPLELDVGKNCADSP